MSIKISVSQTCICRYLKGTHLDSRETIRCGENNTDFKKFFCVPLIADLDPRAIICSYRTCDKLLVLLVSSFLEWKCKKKKKQIEGFL